LAPAIFANRVPVFVHALRSRHPNVPSGELVNYLVTAYCPVVNSLTRLSNGEKQARLRRQQERQAVRQYVVRPRGE
jgi:hypothetical protein